VLSTFLDAKPLYYDTIDYERMPRVYASIKEKLNLPKIIHIIGTNGKGTTGRFLATALFHLGYSVGHYTSPHILEFNERIWMNGKNISNKELDQAHKELLSLLSLEDANALSYFEYTTLLAIYIYQDVDYIVLEAGLGGEHDATAVFENILTIITPIDRDHEAFLGNTLKEIATTKLAAIQKRVIIAEQKHSFVYTLLEEMAEKKVFEVFKYRELLEDKDFETIKNISQTQALPSYLSDNLSVAVATLKLLEIPYSIESFKESRLYGRLTKIAPNITIDVGHNVLAARAISKTLQGERYSLVYNSYKDKNYKEILELLSPIINEVLLIDVTDSRIEEHSIMQDTLEKLNIIYSDFTGVNESKNYLVFGSFSVVEAFLRQRK
jgi:dihydrofolate synthase/folylpolyglutamate synthase